MSYVLETKDLTKKYKDLYAVSNLNMHIEEGDIYGFVGENGAGKTTVIRLITGLAHPTSGKYDLFGISSDTKEIYNAKQQISGIIEAVSVNRNMTALENMRLQAIITNTSVSDDRLIELIKYVGLNYDEIQRKKAGNFSLGMRQRLGIAMSIVSSPKFILLDEPMNGLDPQGFIDVREIIMKLHEDGVTILISSHILAELDKICNKIGFISHGVLLEEITMQELHDKTKKKLVIEVDDVNKLDELLKEDFSFNNVVKEGNKLSIYDNIDINKMMAYLVKKDVKVNNIGFIQDTIEDYYINLIVRGEKNA